MTWTVAVPTVLGSQTPSDKPVHSMWNTGHKYNYSYHCPKQVFVSSDKSLPWAITIAPTLLQIWPVVPMKFINVFCLTLFFSTWQVQSTLARNISETAGHKQRWFTQCQTWTQMLNAFGIYDHLECWHHLRFTTCTRRVISRRYAKRFTFTFAQQRAKETASTPHVTKETLC